MLTPLLTSPSLILGLGILLLLAFVFIIILSFRFRRLERRLRTLFSGKEAADLETILIEEKERVRAMDEEIQDLFEISNQIHSLARKSLHKTSIMRFNPFKEVGGNQSFAVALLDGKDNGIVFSSLHTREGTRVYAKPVKAGEADGFPLTDEEKTVIGQAKSLYREKKV